MNSSDVARVTRWMLGFISRRKLIRASFLLLGTLPGIGRAAQISQLACGVNGDVCTLLHGCCEGLTCATSRINTAYGVCVAGQGGTMAVTDSVIAPGDRGTAQHVATLAANVNGASGDTSTTDAAAAREARIQDKKARRAARKDRQHEALVRHRARENDQQDRRKQNRSRETPADPTPTPTPTPTPSPTPTPDASPNLEFHVVNAGGVGGTETLVVTNRATSNAALNGIASMAEYIHGDMTMLTEGSIPPLTPGASFTFLSIPEVKSANVVGRRSDPVCSAASSNDGFVVRAAFTPNSINTDYYVLCDNPAAARSFVTSSRSGTR